MAAESKYRKTAGAFAGFCVSTSLHTISAAVLWGVVGYLVKTNPSDRAITLAVIAISVGFAVIAIFDGFYSSRLHAGLMGKLYTKLELEQAKQRAFADGQQSMAAARDRQARKESDSIMAGGRLAG